MKKVFLLITLFLPIITSINAEVTIASWGGAYTDSQIKGYKNTYTKPSSIKFVNYSGGFAELRSQLESGNVKWDIKAGDFRIWTLEKYKNLLLELIDRDSQSYDNVISAFRLPKKTPEDIKKRDAMIEAATLGAAQTPLKILENCTSLLKQLLIITEHGNRNSITDSGVSAHLVKTAAYGAALNVLINLKDLNKKTSKEYKEKVDYYLKDIDDLFVKSDKIVTEYLNNDK